MCKFITDDIEISSDDFGKEDSDEQKNSENSFQKNIRIFLSLGLQGSISQNISEKYKKTSLLLNF